MIVVMMFGKSVRWEAESAFIAGRDEVVSMVVRIWRSDRMWAYNWN